MSQPEQSDRPSAARKTGKRRGRRRGRSAALLGGGLVLVAIGAAGWFFGGCGGWDPRQPFMRNSPEVDRAVSLIESEDPQAAAEVLESYLGTGPCSEGSLGLPARVRERADGAFDLGLALFYVAEKFGTRFGEEPGGPEQGADAEGGEGLSEKRSLEIDCAQAIVKVIAGDNKVAAELRARSLYLSGNLEFLRGQYEDAVVQYDAALTLVPGIADDAKGDGIGRDAAWNRAIALRRIQEEEEKDEQDKKDDEDKKDEQDKKDDEDKKDDGEGGGKPDEDKKDDGEGGGKPDEDKKDDGEGGGKPDEDKKDDGGGGKPEDEEPGPAKPPPESGDPQEGEPPATSRRGRMDRLLDELEDAPTYQEEDAKKRARKIRGRAVMEDK